jgi:hypothetical protein
MKVASNYDSDGDADTQPGRDVPGSEAQCGADSGAQNNTQRDLHG